MIKLQVLGNVGKDAVVNNVNGKNVINFSVCHTEKWKDNQGVLHEKAQWVSVAYWSDKTTIASYIKKGTTIFVEGIPESKSFTKQDGTTTSELTLRAIIIQLVGGNKSENQPTNGNQASVTPTVAVSGENGTDLPF